MTNRIKKISLLLIIMTLLALYLTGGDTKGKIQLSTTNRKIIKLSHTHKATVQRFQHHFAEENLKKYLEENLNH